jgi:drug/metabolite transporter (DMT)-like permease
MLGATCSYGFIIVYTKKYTQQAPNMGSAVGSLLLPALVVMPYAVTQVPWVMPAQNVVFALLGLAILCSSIAYLLYFRLIRDVGSTRAISTTFLVPVFGVLWGALLFGEKLNGGAMVGGAVVLLGMALVLGIVPRKKSPLAVRG